MRKRTKGMLIVISLFLLAFFFVPGFRSEVIMRPLSFLVERDSVMSQQGFKIILPDGQETKARDWTSSIKIYHTRAFERAENPISATILYNFGYFSKGRSVLYDSESIYEMAYYGAYAVAREGDAAFGFTGEGTINPEELALIPLYDLEVLVLEGLGCPKDLAKAKLLSVETADVDPAHPLSGWTRVDTEIETRSPIHTRDSWNQNDLQYGPPPKRVAEDFPPLTVKGRIYAKAFPQWEATIYLYIFAKDQALIDKTDKEFLQKVQVRERYLWER